MKKNYSILKCKLFFLLIFVFQNSKFYSQTVQNFSFTGSMQTFTVPSCVSTISVDLRGAQGAIAPTYFSVGGLGGRVVGVFTVTPGQVLNIFVGGQNFNGGGTGATYGGVGGGASDIRTGGTALSNRIFVAGGGGGGGVNCFGTTNPGGAGGGTLAVSGQQCGLTTDYVGTGGSQTTGGISLGSLGQSGALGLGGNGSPTYGGGGGGGFYGGGGGSYGGGGGGSSYAMPTASSVVHTQGFNTGNGIVTLTYNTGLIVNLSATNTVICNGSSAGLTYPGALTYTWSTGSNASSITVNPNTTTTYTLQGTLTGCTFTGVTTITVSPGAPTLAIVSSTNSTCLGKTATLTATGALTYTWSNNVTNGVAFTPSVTNIYTVSGQNGCGTTTAVTTISVAPIAVTLISNPTVVCAGSTSTLSSAAAANSYTWFPVSSNSPSLIVSPLVNTIYTVIASDGTCSGTSTVAVNALPVPTIVASPSISTVCSGVPVNLTASGGISYTWTPGNLTGASITVSPNAPTGYQVVGSNSLGCTSQANAVIITNASPTLNATADKNLICSGDPVILSSSGASSYLWNNGATTASINVAPSVSTIYSVTGIANGCSTTETVSISVFIPTLSITGNTSICTGETSTLVASSANTYLWANGFTSAAIQVNPLVNTIYALTALSNSSGINCPSSASIQVTVKSNPTITATASRTNMCKGENNTLNASGASTYSWNTGASTASFVITPSLVTTVTYSVLGIGSNACTGTTSIQVKINSCTGLNQLNTDNNLLSVYPNPSNGELKIKAEQVMDLHLVNELGQVIKSIQLNANNNYETTLNELSAGIYFITGIHQNSQINQKIIVTK